MNVEHRLAQMKVCVNTLNEEKEKMAASNFSLQDSASKLK